MKRALAIRLLALAALVGLLGAAAAPAQDQIRYFNRKTQKEDSVKATVTAETPGKITYQVGSGKPEDVAAVDILEIRYQAPRALNALEYRAPFAREDRALLEKGAKRVLLLKEALQGYQDILPKLAGARAHQRNTAFRATQVLAALAEADPNGAEAAVTELRKFIAEQGDGWQLVPATKSLVRMLEIKGDQADILAAYDDAARNPAVTPEVRREFGLLATRHLLRRGKAAEAAARLKTVREGVARDDPLLPRLEVYQAACALAAGRAEGVDRALQKVIGGDADNDVKALARNTLGDYFLARGDKEEAFWQYLWVDITYNQDREELARALYQLSRLYADVRKDTVRARECLERLADEKEFGGLELHKKALAERAAPGS
jgi:hypothetical protein